MDRLNKKHINVDAISKAYKCIGSSCNDDDFLDEALFSMETIPNEYIDIWNYLSEFKFLEGVASKIKRKITQASRPYTLVDGVLCRVVTDGKYLRAIGHDEKKELIREMHDGICEG